MTLPMMLEHVQMKGKDSAPGLKVDMYVDQMGRALLERKCTGGLGALKVRPEDAMTDLI